MIELSANARFWLGVILCGYLVMLVGLSIFASTRVQNEEDYLVAGRRLPLFLALGTLIATWFGAATMTGSAEAARNEGLLGVILDPFACSVTLVLAGLFFAKPLWRLKLLTISDFHRRCYGERAEVLAACVQVSGNFGWIAAQYIALGAVLNAYFDVPMGTGILVSASVTLVYTMIGGMWSVTLTDTLQICIALIGLVVLADATFAQYGGGSALAGLDQMLANADDGHLRMLPEASSVAILAYIGTWATGLFGNIPGQDLQQRVFASKSPRVAAQACILAGIIYLAFGLIPVGLGILSTLTDPGDHHGKILQLLAGKYLTPTMAIVFVVAFVSIVVSTATSAVLAPATILGHNLLGRFTIFAGWKLTLDRMCVFLISCGGLALAYWGKSIMDLLDLSLSLALTGVFVPLVMGLYGRPRGALPGILSIALGISFFLPRYTLEELFLPLSDAAEAAGIGYDAFLAAQFPAVSGLARLYGMVSADLQGLAMSLFGYFLGQFLCRGHPPVNDEIRRQAFATDDALHAG